jgi:protein-S-isoprenylcysteine O-methyltransferase Ste14
MQRFMVFVYGLISYAIFFATFVYAIGFVGNLWVPKSIDSVTQVPLAQALLINLAFLALFAVQHSLMARPSFKLRLTRFIPKEAERSTCVLTSSLLLIVLFRFWEPMGGIVWDIGNETGQILMHCAFLFGWLLALACTFMINHFDLFGLRQVWLNLHEEPYTELPFVTPFVYRLVRHPLYLGWLLAFWATPMMTLAHIVFAMATTAYIFIAIKLEERDLAEKHPEYLDYRKLVPMIFPLPHKWKVADFIDHGPAKAA